MEAIRQYLKVEGKTLQITLPDDFIADEVEVIILPKNENIYLSDQLKTELEKRLNEPLSGYISSEESINDLKKSMAFTVDEH